MATFLECLLNSFKIYFQLPLIYNSAASSSTCLIWQVFYAPHAIPDATLNGFVSFSRTELDCPLVQS